MHRNKQQTTPPASPLISEVGSKSPQGVDEVYHQSFTIELSSLPNAAHTKFASTSAPLAVLCPDALMEGIMPEDDVTEKFKDLLSSAETKVYYPGSLAYFNQHFSQLIREFNNLHSPSKSINPSEKYGIHNAISQLEQANSDHAAFSKHLRKSNPRPSTKNIQTLDDIDRVALVKSYQDMFDAFSEGESQLRKIINSTSAVWKKMTSINTDGLSPLQKFKLKYCYEYHITHPHEVKTNTLTEGLSLEKAKKIISDQSQIDRTELCFHNNIIWLYNPTGFCFYIRGSEAEIHAIRSFAEDQCATLLRRSEDTQRRLEKNQDQPVGIIYETEMSMSDDETRKDGVAKINALKKALEQKSMKALHASMLHQVLLASETDDTTVDFLDTLEIEDAKYYLDKFIQPNLTTLCSSNGSSFSGSQHPSSISQPLYGTHHDSHDKDTVDFPGSNQIEIFRFHTLLRILGDHATPVSNEEKLQYLVQEYEKGQEEIKKSKNTLKKYCKQRKLKDPTKTGKTLLAFIKTHEKNAESTDIVQTAQTLLNQLHESATLGHTIRTTRNSTTFSCNFHGVSFTLEPKHAATDTTYAASEENAKNRETTKDYGRLAQEVDTLKKQSAEISGIVTLKNSSPCLLTMLRALIDSSVFKSKKKKDIDKQVRREINSETYVLASQNDVHQQFIITSDDTDKSIQLLKNHLSDWRVEQHSHRIFCTPPKCENLSNEYIASTYKNILQALQKADFKNFTVRINNPLTYEFKQTKLVTDKQPKTQFDTLLNALPIFIEAFSYSIKNFHSVYKAWEHLVRDPDIQHEDIWIQKTDDHHFKVALSGRKISQSHRTALEKIAEAFIKNWNSIKKEPIYDQKLCLKDIIPVSEIEPSHLSQLTNQRCISAFRFIIAELSILEQLANKYKNEKIEKIVDKIHQSRNVHKGTSALFQQHDVSPTHDVSTIDGYIKKVLNEILEKSDRAQTYHINLENMSPLFDTLHSISAHTKFKNEDPSVSETISLLKDLIAIKTESPEIAMTHPKEKLLVAFPQISVTAVPLKEIPIEPQKAIGSQPSKIDSPHLQPQPESKHQFIDQRLLAKENMKIQYLIECCLYINVKYNQSSIDPEKFKALSDLFENIILFLQDVLPFFEVELSETEYHSQYYRRVNNDTMGENDIALATKCILDIIDLIYHQLNNKKSQNTLLSKNASKGNLSHHSFFSYKHPPNIIRKKGALESFANC